MSLKKPRTVEEDMQSEIAHASGEKGVAQYRVTLAAQSHDPYDVKNIYSELCFLCPGMRDYARMKRAMYYFDLALFREGRHRHRLLSNEYLPEKQSSQMYSCMIAAYIAFADTVLKLDGASTMFVSRLELCADVTLIEPRVSPIRILLNRPEPLQFDLVYCHECLRIEELHLKRKDEHEHICQICRQKKAKLQACIPEDVPV